MGVNYKEIGILEWKFYFPQWGSFLIKSTLDNFLVYCKASMHDGAFGIIEE